MSRSEYDAAILMADITGSTPLYEDVGDAAALALVGECLDALRSVVDRHGGKFIRTKGDDVLCAFTDASAALKAAREILSNQFEHSLGVHIGIHFGHIIHARDDIFGDAVNSTARLAAFAKAGETLATQDFVDQLPDSDTEYFRVFDNITFKGKASPTEIFKLLDDGAIKATDVALGHASGHTRTQHEQIVPEVTVTLRHAGNSYVCNESVRLSIGRSMECDVVIDQPWISREHLTIAVRRGKVQLSDQSSTGTYVSIDDGYDFFMRRETVLLTASGVISPATRPGDLSAEMVHYQIDRVQRDHE